jgi:thiamine pyrophosphate-dependent acetolactate synthase large subunit-like protein
VSAVDALTVPPRPVPAPEWGSDVAAEMLRRLGFEYVALNPGASFRGLHDSLVNYLGNQRPGMILCNHEEVAVAIAHGYAKACDRPMAAVVHSNVGLMHATMALFDLWADRVPAYVLGATGPMDSTQRRPWIDWIHTAHAQGSIVRDYTKYETQPSSIASIPEAMLRAWYQMLAEPCGPVYVCLDAGLQEQRLDGTPIRLPDVGRFPLPTPPEPAAEAVRAAARLLVDAEYPLLMVGRSTASQRLWNDLVQLAEALGMAVLSDLKTQVVFPTNHPFYLRSPANFGDEAFFSVLDQADAVLALDWIDLAGTLTGTAAAKDFRGLDVPLRQPRVVQVSLDHYAVRSAAADYFALAEAEVRIAAAVEPSVSAILAGVQQLLADDSAARGRVERRAEAHRRRRAELEAVWAASRDGVWSRRPISYPRMVGELANALGDRRDDAVLARTPLIWPAGVWSFTRPKASLGNDGGGGVGSGPGMVVGTALALRDSGRLTIGILGDGDTLMANTALWTAAHHRIPFLLVVANNRSYLNDEVHQERMARVRGRPVENKWIGQRMDDPPVDFPALARSMGVEGFGPVHDPDDLLGVYQQALRAVDEGRPALVEVVVGTS